jgi:hypothetical protein
VTATMYWPMVRRSPECSLYGDCTRFSEPLTKVPLVETS